MCAGAKHKPMREAKNQVSKKTPDKLKLDAQIQMKHCLTRSEAAALCTCTGTKPSVPLLEAVVRQAAATELKDNSAKPHRVE